MSAKCIDYKLYRATPITTVKGRNAIRQCRWFKQLTKTKMNSQHRVKYKTFFFIFNVQTCKTSRKIYNKMLNLTTTTNIKERRIFTFSPVRDKSTFFFSSVLKSSFLTFPHSSLNRWRAESWSSGLKRSSKCPNSCVVQKDWSWRTVFPGRRRLVRGWRLRWVWRVRWASGARRVQSALGGSCSGKARFEVSR